MVFASIDVGSNAVRMLIADHEKGAFRRLRYERVTTRLASTGPGGTLTGESRSRTLRALADYSRILAGFGVASVKAVGTSALREAAGVSEFVAEVFEKTGIRIEVISPRKEAELTAKGVCRFLPGLSDALILDIGGGSTEWITIGEGRLLACGSIPVGVVKLSTAAEGLDETAARRLLDAKCSCFAGELRRQAAPLPERASFVLTGGTGSALACLDLGLENYDHGLIHGRVIAVERLREIFERLKGLGIEERKHLRGLPPDRADLIIPGAGLTIYVMAAFPFDSLTVSDTGLPEGLLIELSEKTGDEQV
jgi:exopolyphosphatase/guanosine-5'-triphosphate,3'-diphosphate pyrophosphatase